VVTHQVLATAKRWPSSTNTLPGSSLTSIGDPDKIIQLAQREFAIPLTTELRMGQ
jgi:hypothetical protein